MAKLFVSPTIKFALFFAVATVLYFFFFDSPATTKKAASKTVAKRSTTSANSDVAPEDYSAHFAIYQTPLKNAFKPLVIRNNVRGESGGAKANGVPAYMAGGDANWVYTGTAEVDGVPTVLIENTSTGEGFFLRQSERWRDLTISRITPDSVVLVGSDGEIVTLNLVSPGETEEEIKPLNPDNPLNGAIGGGAVTGPGANSAAAQASQGFGNMAIEAAPAAAPAPAQGRSLSGRRGNRNRSASNTGGSN